MPRLQFTQMSKGINKLASFPTPKRMNELRFWLKAAQQWCKEIPRQIGESEPQADRLMGSDGWYVFNSDADAKWIKFELRNRYDDKAQIVIDRKASNM